MNLKNKSNTQDNSGNERKPIKHVISTKLFPRNSNLLKIILQIMKNKLFLRDYFKFSIQTLLELFFERITLFSDLNY